MVESKDELPTKIIINFIVVSPSSYKSLVKVVVVVVDDDDVLMSIWVVRYRSSHGRDEKIRYCRS